MNCRFVLPLFCLLFNSPAFAQQRVPEKIDEYIQSRLRSAGIPGLAIAVVYRDSVVMAKGYGVNSNGQPITSNTPFAIASLSKAFTAAAILQLAEKKLVSLDSPVIKYIPSFKLKDARGPHITIRNLLNQTSGLSDKVFPELAFSIKNPTTCTLLLIGFTM